MGTEKDRWTLNLATSKKISLPCIVFTQSKPWKSHNFTVISAEQETEKKKDLGLSQNI